eukprot:4761773-Pleurochrysis_carterae.AAC.1
MSPHPPKFTVCWAAHGPGGTLPSACSRRGRQTLDLQRQRSSSCLHMSDKLSVHVTCSIETNT